MTEPYHLTMQELEAGLETVNQSPKDRGILELIVRRPGTEERETTQEGTLTPEAGLVGDNWNQRKSSRTPDGSPHPDMQVTLMNTRFVNLIAGSKDRWALAGDQLYVDLDLSESNLPPGTRVKIGSALLEITSQPHTGCPKFSARFGRDCLAFVNGPARKALKLRGIYAKVIEAGKIQVGDYAEKMSL